MSDTWNLAMDGRQIQRIWWNGDGGDKSMVAEGQRTLRLSYSYHGDHDEAWVEEYVDMREVARHNCKYIASIEWVDTK